MNDEFIFSINTWYWILAISVVLLIFVSIMKRYELILDEVWWILLQCMLIALTICSGLIVFIDVISWDLFWRGAAFLFLTVAGTAIVAFFYAALDGGI